MYLKYLTFIFVLLSVKNIEAQTKPTLEETVDWIVAKLNACTPVSYVDEIGNCKSLNSEYKSHSEEGVKFLIIVYSSTYVCKDVNATTTLDVRIEIPIADIKNVIQEKRDKDTLLEINTYNKDIFFTFFNKNGSVQGQQITSTSVSIPFNFKMEQDLFKRLQKAFENLVSYFPKKKEAF